MTHDDMMLVYVYSCIRHPTMSSKALRI